MALPPLRPMRGELLEGMTDGTYKKAVMNRGGFVEPCNYEDYRSSLADTWYGIHETPVKTSPTTGQGVTPDTVITRPMRYPGG